MTFGQVYDQFIDDIEATAFSQYVMGMDQEDVVSEMVGCLWKAWKTHDPAKGSLGGYWWSLWLNRRRDLNRDAARLKRPVTIPAGDWMSDGVLSPTQSYTLEHLPIPSAGMGRDVWILLASGCSPQEVREAVGITKRGYYGLIHCWRTKQVWDMLTNS